MNFIKSNYRNKLEIRITVYIHESELHSISITCRLERKKYYSHREKARREPDKYTTIILDGMDQADTNLPYLVQTTKSTQNLWRIRPTLQVK